MQNKEVCVLLPFYNEEEILGEVIANLKTKNYFVLGIDDGSSDQIIWLHEVLGIDQREIISASGERPGTDWLAHSSLVLCP